MAHLVLWVQSLLKGPEHTQTPVFASTNTHLQHVPFKNDLFLLIYLEVMMKDDITAYCAYFPKRIQMFLVKLVDSSESLHGCFPLQQLTEI